MWTSPVVLLMLLGACTRFTPEGEPPQVKAPCVTYEPYEGMGNHLNPYEIAVDAQQRLVYSTSLGNRTLGVYSADNHEVLGMYPIRELAQVRPDVVADASGAVWVLGSSAPAVVRFGNQALSRRQYAQPLTQALRGVALPEGGIVVLGAGTDGSQLLQRFEADGTIGSAHTLDGWALGMFLLRDGRIALLMNAWETTGLQLLDPESLDPVGSCALPFLAYRGAQLEDSTIVLSTDTAIGLAGCDGAPPVAWQVGVENKDVISLSTHALVLDRVGSGEGVDPNLGLAHRVDRQGVHAEQGFVTAKNTGYGALDPHTGLLWVNSEGSAELVAYDPSTGQEQARIRTGTFMDGLAVDPDAEHSYFATGRLSNSFLRIDNTKIVAESNDVTWPFSPVVDSARGLVWVVSQTAATVHGHAKADLSPQRTIDPGLASNDLLTFSSLLLHPDRDTLFFAESDQDLLLELDPDEGGELARWDLGGPLVVDPDVIGHLASVVDPTTGAIFLVRTNDGRIQRLDPDSGVLDTAWLSADALAAYSETNTVDIVHLLSDTGLLYVGGMAFDTTSLERSRGHDLPIRRLVGVHPWTSDHLLAVGEDGMSLVEITRDGTVTTTQPFAARELNAPTFRIAIKQNSVLVVNSQDARLCWFGFARIRD